MRRIVAFALFLQYVGATSNFTSYTLGRLVSQCGTNWGCFKQGCDSPSGSRCSYIAMYRQKNTKTFEFILSTKGNAYAALGFSTDRLMGDDEVMACMKLADGRITADHYANPGGHTGSMRSGTFLLELLDYFDENGQIGCLFTRPVQAMGITGYYDLTRPYYQLYPFGPVQNDRIAFHAPVRHPSTSAKEIFITTDRQMVSKAVRGVPAMVLTAAFLMAFAL